MRRIVIALAIAGCALASLAGCSNATYENGSGELSERFEGGEALFRNKGVITDKKTGVEYLIVEDGHRMAVCPLYNPDGTLCTETD